MNRQAYSTITFILCRYFHNNNRLGIRCTRNSAELDHMEGRYILDDYFCGFVSLGQYPSILSF